VAARSSGPVALISIHPQFADRILTGRKRVEFRKMRFTNSITHVVLYATSPVKRILGYFTVKGIDHASPPDLWRRYQGVAGIEEASFFSYFRKCNNGIAIKVDKVFRLPEPHPLSILDSELTPPRSFCYLPIGSVERLTRRIDQSRSESILSS